MNGQSFDVARVKTGRTLIWDFRGRRRLPIVQICPLLLSLFPGFFFTDLGWAEELSRHQLWSEGGGLIGAGWYLENWTGYNLTAAHNSPLFQSTQDWWQVGRLPLSPLLPRLSLLSAGVCCFASQLPPVASQNLKTEGGANSLCFSIWGHQQWRSDCTQSKTWWSYSELGWFFLWQICCVIIFKEVLKKCRWKEEENPHHPRTLSQDVLPQNSLTHIFF